MGVLAILLPGLPLGGCSYGGKPDPDTTSAAAAPLPPARTRPDPAEVAAEQRRQAIAREQDGALLEAAGTLHSYLGALASGHLDAADMMWAGGKPPPAPDDAALRALGPRSMHIDTGAPRPLDADVLPSRALEIPVSLRMRDAAGNARPWSGWYRLRRRTGGDGWEIATAWIQPTIN